MKLTALAAAALLASASVALAAPTHRGFPSPFTPFTPPHSAPAPRPSVIPAPGSPQETKDVLTALLEVQAQFVADVNTADQWATLSNGATPSGPIDPIGHACWPVLATWAGSLTPPAAPASGPSGGLVTDFEKLRVGEIEANNLINNIVTNGFPPSLTVACGGVIVDTVTQGGRIIGNIAAFNTLLAKFIPAAVLGRHNVGHLAR